MALANPTQDSIGQRCVVMKLDGDHTASDVYFAIRTTGPYAVTDGDIIRSGAGAVATDSQPNISRVYSLAVGLDADTTHYWGAVKDTGNAVLGQFDTKIAPEPETGGTIPGARILA
jgi:hypothetical protein